MEPPSTQPFAHAKPTPTRATPRAHAGGRNWEGVLQVGTRHCRRPRRRRLRPRPRRPLHTVGFCCCFVAKPLFFHALVCRPFALLVAPFFTSAVAPGAKLSRPRHHALGGTSLAPSPVHSFELANLQDDPKRPPLPVCFMVSADEAVPSQGPQGRRPRAGARPRSLRFGHVHQPGSRMHAVLVEGQRLANAAVRRTVVLNSLLSHVDPGPRVKGFEGIAPLMCPCCVEDVTGTEGPPSQGTYLPRSCCHCAS